MILRYTLAERIIHWISGLTYIYQLMTGLAFYTPHLYWMASVLGGGATSRYWHPIIGLVFTAALLWMFWIWVSDMRITQVDHDWNRGVEHYVRNEEELVPPSDRFNAGQKYFFWIMLFAGLVMLVSGIGLWIPESIPRSLRYAAVLLHVSAALASIGAFILHVYMGTAFVRGSFTAMVRGVVAPAWARMHHRLWYNRVTGSR